MFQAKKFLNVKNPTRKLKDDRSDFRAKKILHVKKKSRKSPNKIINYKQTLRHRLTVKQGIFPHAIQTNILSRHCPHRQSPKNPSNNEGYDPHQKNSSFDFFNKILCEEQKSNFPVSQSPPRNMHRKSRMLNCQSEMSLNDAASTPEKNNTALDTINYNEIDEDTNMDHASQSTSTNQIKEAKEIRKPSIQFTYHRPQEAQQILLFQELAQVINKTMIIEKVSHFENFSDTMQELHDKLWETRSSRDTNFDPDADSAIRHKVNSSDFSSDDEFNCDKNSSSFHLGEPKTPIDENFMTPPLAFKIPDRCNEKKAHGMIGPKVDFDVNECNKMDVEEENSESNGIAYRPRRDNKLERREQNSVFNSTLITTCKLDQNLTLNAIEFLENLSKPSDDKSKEHVYRSNDNLNAHKSPEPVDTKLKFNECRPSCQEPADGLSNEWFSDSDPLESFQKEYEQFRPRESLINDNRFSRNLDVLTREETDRVGGKAGGNVPYKPVDRRKENFSDFDCIFPIGCSQTPEMNYYPRRLY